MPTTDHANQNPDPSTIETGATFAVEYQPVHGDTIQQYAGTVVDVDTVSQR